MSDKATLESPPPWKASFFLKLIEHVKLHRENEYIEDITTFMIT